IFCQLLPVTRRASSVKAHNGLHCFFSAAGTFVWMIRLGCRPCYCRFRRLGQLPFYNYGGCLLAGTAKNTIVADTHKSFRQYVHAKATDELKSIKGHLLFYTSMLIIFVTKRYCICFTFFDAMIADGYFMGVKAGRNLLLCQWPVVLRSRNQWQQYAAR